MKSSVRQLCLTSLRVHACATTQVQSERLCQTSFDEEEAVMHWKLDREAAQRERNARCIEVKHTFVRTARECTNVDFIMHEVRISHYDMRT